MTENTVSLLSESSKSFRLKLLTSYSACLICKLWHGSELWAGELALLSTVYHPTGLYCKAPPMLYARLYLLAWLPNSLPMTFSERSVNQNVFNASNSDHSLTCSQVSGAAFHVSRKAMLCSPWQHFPRRRYSGWMPKRCAHCLHCIVFQANTPWGEKDIEGDSNWYVCLMLLLRLGIHMAQIQSLPHNFPVYTPIALWQ